MALPMLFRFSAYGFLKNQQYYEPFIILAFRQEKGLSFFMIGLLIGFRELSVNLMEVPTGVVADLFGRRRSMILSLCSYIVSFLVFGLSAVTWHLFAAMFFFAVGEAFRTGTHKAMILDWLRLEGRPADRTRTYGFTRAWSKIGSAVAVIIATGLVFTRGNYSDVFLFCIVPYLVGIANFLGYPRELDGQPEGTPSVRGVFVQLVRAFRQVWARRRLRRVLLESMGYQSTSKVTATYVQPVLRQLALALPVLVAVEAQTRTTLLAGAVYLVLAVVSAFGSFKSGSVAAWFGDEARAARGLWGLTLGGFVVVAAALWFGLYGLAVLGFIVLLILFNFWRPITITRVDNETEARMGATMLSIESQAQALAAMALAPLLGLAVDRLGGGPEAPALWVVGAVGAVVALVGVLVPTMAPAPGGGQAGTGQG